MDKKILLVIGFCICFLSACSASINYCQLENPRTISSGEYHKIIEGDGFEYCYYIYNSDKEVVLKEKTYGKPPTIEMLNDDIIDIHIGMGTGVIIHKYYSVKRNAFSENFEYVIANSNELVAYINISDERQPFENRTVIVQDAFDKSVFFKEFKLNFSNVDTPVLNASFSKENTQLEITYLSGNNQTEISETINLK